MWATFATFCEDMFAKILPYLLGAVALIGALFAAKKVGVNAEKLVVEENQVKMDQGALNVSQAINTLDSDAVSKQLREFNRD